MYMCLRYIVHLIVHGKGNGIYKLLFQQDTHFAAYFSKSQRNCP